MTGDPYGDALGRHGLADVQPLYRQLLRRLKGRDAGAYEEAVARYRDEVEAVVDTAEDPVAVWVGYGAWLAPQLDPGELVSVDPNGRALPAGSPPPLGPLLMYLPADARSRGLVLAMPSDPSPAQRATAALLCIQDVAP